MANICLLVCLAIVGFMYYAMWRKKASLVDALDRQNAAVKAIREKELAMEAREKSLRDSQMEIEQQATAIQQHHQVGAFYL